MQIEEFVKQKGAYFLLKNTHELKTKELELEIEMQNAENIEEETISIYSKENPSKLNKLIQPLINSLGMEKQEDEKNVIFENRVFDSAKKILEL